jgi:hypothetical protein
MDMRRILPKIAGKKTAAGPMGGMGPAAEDALHAKGANQARSFI